VLLFVYIALVLLGTLAVQGRSFFEWIHLLVPPGKFRDMLFYPLQHHHPVTFSKFLIVADIIGNIFLFLPFGMAIFLVFRQDCCYSLKKLLFTALAIGMILSLSIEIFQYLVPKRIPSVSDIIANTSGTVLGCYILYVLRNNSEE
jgi:glycopeptide antibiotics resistance protein